MGIFESEGTILQGSEFRNHLNRNWKNGNDAIDSINSLITKDPTGVQKDEVEAARTDIHGTTYSVLKSRLDADQVKGENALDEVVAKADKNYVDNLISSLAAGGPLELFYSIDALNAKYPNGAGGSYLVLDSSFGSTAHTFIWNDGSWKDAGPYGGIQISDGSISFKGFDNFLNSVINLKNMGYSNRILNQKIYDLNSDFYRNGIFDHDSKGTASDPGNFVLGKLIAVKKNDITILYGATHKNSSPIVLLDNNGHYVEDVIGYPSGDYPEYHGYTYTASQDGYILISVAKQYMQNNITFDKFYFEVLSKTEESEKSNFEEYSNDDLTIMGKIDLDGNPVNDSNWKRTDFVEITSFDEVRFRTVGETVTLNVAFFDKNKIFILGKGFETTEANLYARYGFSGKIIAPSKAAYVIFSSPSISSISYDMTCLFEISKQGKKSSKEIVCWGDSLTAMGGWTDELANLSGLTVKNGGTGGENVRTIAARQGADSIVFDNLNIPASTDQIEIGSLANPLKSQFGYDVTPLLQGGTSHVNPVRIGDVEGTLIWTGAAYDDTSGKYLFNRNQVGNAETINRTATMTTAYDRMHNSPYLMIIFMGQNGGYNDNNDLVRMHKLMIEHAHAKNVLILGMHTGTASSRADYEKAMLIEFGRTFFSLRQYLTHPIYDADGTTIKSCWGLDDAGLEATADDLAKISEGQVPYQLLIADHLHFTESTRTVIGKAIYNYLAGLNIF